MATVTTIVAFLLALTIPLEAQAENSRYVALPYVVRVQEPSVGMSEIRPRYLWLDDHRLIIPTKDTIDEREWEDVLNISVFVLDVSAGTAVRVADYGEVFGLTLTASRGSDLHFISPIVDLVVDDTSPIGVRRVYKDYALDTSTLDLTPTTLSNIQEQRAAVQPGSPRPYPDALLRVDTNDLYTITQRSSANYFYWNRWNDFIVALGARDGTDHTDPHDVRLYNDDGSTAFVFPHIRVYNDHVLGFPEVFQLSPEGRFLFLNENIATQSAREVLGLRDIRSVIYLYGFEEKDPAEDYDTIVYAADTEDFGAGYAIGEVFEMEREVVDGSAFSGGPVVAAISHEATATEVGTQSSDRSTVSAQPSTVPASSEREPAADDRSEESREEQRASLGIIAGGIAAVLIVVLAVAMIVRRRRS